MAGTGVGRRAATTLAVVLMLAACSGGDDGDEASEGGSTTASTATTVLDPAGFPVYDVADRQEERWEILTSPDWLVTDGERMFVKSDTGAIDEIDPETNELTRTAALPSSHCQGLGYGFDSLWSCVETDVVRIDPDSGEITATLAVGKTAVQGHIPTAFDHVWVLTGDGSTLVAIDPETEEVAKTIALGVRAAQVESGEAGLWVVSTLDDQVLRIDPETGEVALRIETILKPTYLAITDDVWVGASLSTNKVDPDTGEVLLTSEFGTGANGCLAVGEDGVWVRADEDRFLTRLDPDDATPVEGFSSPDTPSSGDTIVAFGSVWTSAYNEASLFRIDPSAE